MAVKVYSEFKEFQIRDCVYFCNNTDVPDNPTRFDVVKWYKHAPMKVHVYEGGEYKGEQITTSGCYSIGFLEWDAREGGWDFESVGLRYLEDTNTLVNNWILGWCEKYAKENFINEHEI